jgi:four helix bundle protein
MAESSFRSLEVWRVSMEVTGAVYQASRAFPRDEVYGVTSQLRRATAAVAANIAEGNGRDHAGDYFRHLSIARGSLCEAETFVELSLRLGYLKAADAEPLFQFMQRVGKMLNKLVQAIKRRRKGEKRDGDSIS